MEVSPPITVAIARFSDLLGLGLRAALADDPSVSVVAEDIEYSRIDVVLQAHRPAVLILDVDQVVDLAMVRDLTVEHPGTHLVLLGDGLSALESSQLLALGAGACLDKSTQARDVRNAIHLVSRGLQLMPRSPAGGPVPAAGGMLTAREGDVLLLLREDRSNAQIALALQIGVETVRTHARSVYRKLGVSSRRALVAAR
jgi:DNA-binding NarL/FixJ family response regulator